MNIRKATQFQRIAFCCNVLRRLADMPAFDAAPNTRMILKSVVAIISSPPSIREVAYESLEKDNPNLVALCEPGSKKQ